MNTTGTDLSSPFQPATATNRRLKLLLWGESGAGKTTLALRFPGPVVIDMEGGTEHYGGAFDFAVQRATTADEVIGAVDWLLTHQHPYRTLVIDPISVFWDALQAKWRDIFLRRNKGGKGHRQEYYDLQPRDWVPIKAEWNELIRKLIRLDMNVIVIARQKTLYADHGFMRAIGETFDGEKSLPYMFDTILRLYRDANGRFMAENLKDRPNKLPHGHFEVSYEALERCLGTEELTREAVPVPLATPEQVDRIRHLIGLSGMKQEKVEQRLAAYGVTRIEELTRDDAQVILEKLAAAVQGKAAH